MVNLETQSRQHTPISKDRNLQALNIIIQLHFEKNLEKKLAIRSPKERAPQAFSALHLSGPLSSRLKYRHCWIPIALLSISDLSFYVSVAQTVRYINGFKFFQRRQTNFNRSSFYLRLRCCSVMAPTRIPPSFFASRPLWPAAGRIPSIFIWQSPPDVRRFGPNLRPNFQAPPWNQALHRSQLPFLHQRSPPPPRNRSTKKPSSPTEIPLSALFSPPTVEPILCSVRTTAIGRS
ncbi:unnamed protein product [Citrullus colocynthis]|uniref:Uncharacterized protein n=1 Tax=Citrullus colocynthis TaxID=252529 RepID=A0ABP0XSB4_9ROSI